ncbi:MAG: NYN domain-containing protein [Gemmatimonadota bacterium]
MGTHLVVDGYNLARSGALLLAEDPASEAGRQELCALLAGYARAKGFRLTVVFDGRGAGRPDRTRTAFKGGTALYASARETADDAIRAIARDAPSGLVVVTADRGLAGTLSARAVTVVSCAEFAERLEACRIAALKGTGDEEAGRDRGRPKRGEGRRMKKAERARARTLKKL